MILQACPECDRQFDVSHLRPGNRVRCFCDARWQVSRPKELTLRARRCSNCSGRVEPGELACAYCGSELVEPDPSSTLCPACFARIDLEAKHCSHCGVGISPQSLSALKDGQSCPRCAAELCIRALGATSVVECSGCAGMWVTAETFKGICREAREKADVLLGDPVAEEASVPLEASVRYIPCLICGELMLRRQFRYGVRPSRVVVDFCSLHGVWLDAAELERIVAFIRSHANRYPSSHLDPSLVPPVPARGPRASVSRARGAGFGTSDPWSPGGNVVLGFFKFLAGIVARLLV